MRILIVEDEKRLAATLADLLEASGYHADISRNGAEGLELANTNLYDAVILDVMLPGIDGFEVVQRLRNNHIMTPVLMLTARSELEDRVRGLDLGADYYLTKPFENAEFLACLRTVLRRPADIVSDSFSYGDLTLVPSTTRLSCKSHEVALSAKEQEIMRLLIQNCSQYLPKETILLKVWGYDCNVSSNSVEAYISFLRKKLSLMESHVQIAVVRNIGYKLEVSQ